jgi:glutaredoxin
MLHGEFFKMISRPLLTAYGFLFLLLPTLAWALNEAGDAPPVPSAPAQSAPEQTAPVKPVPVKTAPAVPASAPIPVVQAAPAQPLLNKPLPAPASVAPAKPATAPAASVKPAPVPATPAKPAPVLAAPAKPATALASPANPPPAQIPLKKPLPAIPATIQAIPVQSTPAHSAPTPQLNVPIMDAATETVDIEVFIRDDCLHCDKAKEFIAKLHSLQPHLKIIFRDVRKEPAALELLKRMVQNQGGDAIDYPAFVVGGQLIIGFTEEAGTAQLILDTLMVSQPRSQSSNIDSESCETGKELSCGLIPPPPIEKQENIIVNIFGISVPLVQIGLPLFTLAMGMLDGLNHGSTWVLMLMLALLSPLKNRPLTIAIAGTFIAVQGIAYFILLAVWLNIVMLIGVSRISEIVIASIALLAGAMYFVKYMQFGHRISLSSQEITKPGIYSRIRKIVQTESRVAALLSTIVLALLVQAGEFTYTSVFPALYTRVLTLQHLDTLSNYGYLLLYDFAYMLDDLIILSIGVITLRQNRPQEKEGRMLKLISALALVVLGVYLLLARYDLWRLTLA